MRTKSPDTADPRWIEVGKRIRADREAKGIGQAELGRMLGFESASQSMWRYEAGRATIPQPRLEQIAKILGKPAERYTLMAQQKRSKLSAEQLREMHSKLAQAAMAAALEGTPEAIERLNELVSEHYHRTGR